MALLLFVGERFGKLPEDNSSFVGVSTSSWTMGSFPLSQSVGCLLDRYLACLFLQNHTFFLFGPINDRFHAADVQRDPAIPSSALLAPPVSSPCLDANEEINLWATGSSGCWLLQLCQTKQMWKREVSELLEAMGYCIVVGAKFLHVVDETFFFNSHKRRQLSLPGLSDLWDISSAI